MGNKLHVIVVALLLLCVVGNSKGQEASKVSVSVYDGVLVGGYVDEGGYLNFTGPNMNITKGKIKLIAGMLPSLRFKKDQSIPSNAFVTPTLGFGLTFCYRHVALQLPFYYNAKTAVHNGSWVMGVGVGVRFNEFNTKKN